ncbi:hypothetical protein [Actinokineospora iranica]|uniref:Uncharacterized protein n=1 Tax=Actinokineospora iranica TaxID=1271860 RepID=A0A1G6Z6F6_9PSEU|nr:hypothetical protein [Actinokineospora iranica]SDD97853.1 hypothetical protein SAMN05216174_1267 [Actinokineospora iranica]
MDRPTTGKRRVRSGSVHVTELIRKQPPPLTLPADLPSGLSAGLVDEVAAPRTRAAEPADDAPVAHRRPPSRGAQLAKVTGLGLAVITLCGAVATATMIARDRGAARAAAEQRPKVQITGERALLPDELNRAVVESSQGRPDTRAAQRNGTAAGEVSAVPPAQPSSPDQTAATGQSTTGQSTSAAHTGAGDTSPARTGQSQRPVSSSRELVLEYYRLIKVNPSGAFDLLAGDLLGTTLSEFIGSWTAVADIEVLDVQERSDGVLAVIRLRLLDGTHLRIQQLLTVTNTTPQKIIAAELVSAQSN